MIVCSKCNNTSWKLRQILRRGDGAIHRHRVCKECSHSVITKEYIVDDEYTQTRSRPQETTLQRIERLVDKVDGGHWLWRGGAYRGSPCMKGTISNEGSNRVILVRRWLYKEYYQGDPGRKHIRTTCAVDMCIAPEHLDTAESANAKRAAAVLGAITFDQLLAVHKATSGLVADPERDRATKPDEPKPLTKTSDGKPPKPPKKKVAVLPVQRVKVARPPAKKKDKVVQAPPAPPFNFDAPCRSCERQFLPGVRYRSPDREKCRECWVDGR